MSLNFFLKKKKEEAWATGSLTSLSFHDSSVLWTGDYLYEKISSYKRCIFKILLRELFSWIKEFYP